MAAAVAPVARDPPNKYTNTNPTTAAIRFPRIASPLPNPPDPPGGPTVAAERFPIRERSPGVTTLACKPAKTTFGLVKFDANFACQTTSMRTCPPRI